MEYSLILNIYFISLLIGFYVTRNISSLWDSLISLLYLLAFIVISATRPENTPDTISYLNFFELIKNTSNNLGLVRITKEFEIGFTNFSIFMANFGVTSTTYFATISSFQIVVAVLALRSMISTTMRCHKKSVKLIPLLTFYLPYYGFFYATIVLRAGMAISISLLSLALFLEKRYILSVFTYLIAFSFHDTALIFLVVFLLFIILPNFGKTWTLKFAVILNILVVFRIFDKIIDVVYVIAVYLTSHVSSLLRFAIYFNFPRRDTAYSRPILFFSLQILYAVILLRNRGEFMNKILNIGIFAGLVGSFFGSLTEYKRIYDILFLVMLTPMIMTLDADNFEKSEASWIETLLYSKTIRYLVFGVLSTINMYSFLGFSGLR